MAEKSGPSRRVLIGAFVFDAERRQLMGGGGAIAISAREFELLSLLVAKRPRAVSKSEIQETLWPRTVVAETSLTTLVKDLRTKLGQAGRLGPIRTVHGFGYALEGDGEGPVQAPCPRLVRGTAGIRFGLVAFVFRARGAAGDSTTMTVR